MKYIYIAIPIPRVSLGLFSTAAGYNAKRSLQLTVLQEMMVSMVVSIPTPPEASEARP